MKSGQLIAGRYEILGILGKGGMGEVYLAYDRRLATEVALKRVPFDLALDDSIREALVSEARILAKLSHTNIVRLFDLADTTDGLFLVLEYVCGPSLDKVLLKRKTLPPRELQHVMDHVAPGLTRAHSLGVIHRDIKPSNLLVALTGDEQRYFLRDGAIPPTLLNAEIKVTDFGLAKVVHLSRVKASGIVSGTPAYMAPEQFRGELASVETDVYALGLVAYTCLSGKLAIGAAEPMFFHLFVTPPPLEGVPANMNAAIQKAVRKERAERFSSVAAFTKALSQPLQAPAPSPPPPKPRPSKARWIAFSVVCAIIAIILVTVYAVTKRSSSENKTTTAVEESPHAQELPPLPPLNPAPRIDTPPPVIEQARLSVWPYPLPRGIERPKIIGRMRAPGGEVFGFGPDGTLYATDNGGSRIAAVRNGQLAWQYDLDEESRAFSISPDGLIWIRSMHGTGSSVLTPPARVEI